ncbi:MAG: hypothetical protein DWQ35_08230 [Planctomycetota bacterium]|nr:MAG: hypothetical protein DWQ35_08230 [Planctomycetota bacterium]
MSTGDWLPVAKSLSSTITFACASPSSWPAKQRPFSQPVVHRRTTATPHTTSPATRVPPRPDPPPLGSARMPSLARVLLLTAAIALVPLSAAEAQRTAAALPPLEAQLTEQVPPPAKAPLAGEAAVSPAPSGIPIRRPASAEGDSAATASRLPSLATIFGSLGLVLAAFFVLAWLTKRGMPQNLGLLPKEVLEVMGRAPLAQRQYVHLLRCGNRLLLVSVSPAGAETLSEITDPVEVDRLTGLCQQQRSDSVSASFRNVLQQFGRDKKLDAASAIDDTGGRAANDPHAPGRTREEAHAA